MTSHGVCGRVQSEAVKLRIMLSKSKSEAAPGRQVQIYRNLFARVNLFPRVFPTRSALQIATDGGDA